MNKIQLIIGCAGGISLFSSVLFGQKTAHKPNILFILTNDMGRGDVNLNGYDMIETPVLNRLASQNLSFNRFYVCPLNAHARAEMLTGRIIQKLDELNLTEKTILIFFSDNGPNTVRFNGGMKGIKGVVSKEKLDKK